MDGGSQSFDEVRIWLGSYADPNGLGCLTPNAGA